MVPDHVADICLRDENVEACHIDAGAVPLAEALERHAGVRVLFARQGDYRRRAFVVFSSTSSLAYKLSRAIVSISSEKNSWRVVGFWAPTSLDYQNDVDCKVRRLQAAVGYWPPTTFGVYTDGQWCWEIEAELPADATRDFAAITDLVRSL